MVEKSIWIDATPEIIHSFFTVSEKMAQWAGVGARLDPRPGGIYELDMGVAGVMTGRFVEVNALRIVQEVDTNPGKPPSRIEITLSPEAGGTRVTVRHSGLPAPFPEIASRGWDHHLARLSVASTGGTPPPDPLCTRPVETLGS